MLLHNFAALAVILSAAGDATAAGEVSTPYPTITNLAVEWHIQGDENHNGRVSVRFRAVGESAWREAMPLRRVPAGKSRGTRPIYAWDNKHSGSIFDLVPDTEYEIELSLDDSDGGSEMRTVRAKTRPVPRAMPDAPVRRAEPATLAAVARTASPGDVVLLAAGDYGRFDVPVDGTTGKPIVFRAEEAGKAFFRGISLRGRQHVYLEGLACEGERIAIDLLRAEDCAIRRCTITGRDGIWATVPPGAKNCYIADNVITGTAKWTEEALGAHGRNQGEGIRLTGPGNVICYNRVSGFRDCISFAEDQDVHKQVCIDVYNNDVYNGADDGIEADFAMHNCRVMRNRLTNCFVGISSQPGLGGPNYFIRNVLYNTPHTPFKLQRNSVGDVVLHHTVVNVGDGVILFSPVSQALFRNNLFFGGLGGGRINGAPIGSGRAVDYRSPDATCDFDYDGYGTVGTPLAVKIGPRLFSDVASLRRETGQKHAVHVEWNPFVKAAFPASAFPAHAPPDLRLGPISSAVDAGVHLPNVNDGYTGESPDLGAHERGQDLPIYGPRSRGHQSSNRPPRLLQHRWRCKCGRGMRRQGRIRS